MSIAGSPADVLSTAVNVVSLAPTGSVTLAHGIVVGGSPHAPTWIMPNRATAIVVTGATATTVTFNNPTQAPLSANFLCQWWHSMQTPDGAPVNSVSGLPENLYWQGL